MPDKYPWLPTKPYDGMEVLDHYGNKWVYHAEQDAWISKGVVKPLQYVSESNDGIITPEIYHKLEDVESYIQSSIGSTSLLKLSPGTNAYWYYFRSSDNCIRFMPEGSSALRVEIDKSRIYQILMRQVCKGQKGPKGDKGDKGKDGVGLSYEDCFAPTSIYNERMDFAIFVPTPLDEDSPIDLPNDHIPTICIRVSKIGSYRQTTDQFRHLAASSDTYDEKHSVKLHKLVDNYIKLAMGQETETTDIEMSDVIVGASGVEQPMVTIDIDPTLNDPTTISATIPIDEVMTAGSIKFDKDNNIVYGSIYLSSGNYWVDIGQLWCIMARQRGPDGPAGDPGEHLVEIVECDISDDNVVTDSALASARLECDDDTLYALYDKVLGDVCAELISIPPGSQTIVDPSAMKSTFVSAQTTLDECKYIYKYTIDLLDYDVPELMLTHWSPQPGCFTQRHYKKHDFDWIPRTDIPECDDAATWYDISDARPGIYPYKIMMAPEPIQDACCEEDFFWCTDVQNASRCDCDPSSPSASAAVYSNDIVNTTRYKDTTVGMKRWTVGNG